MIEGIIEGMIEGRIEGRSEERIERKIEGRIKGMTTLTESRKPPPVESHGCGQNVNMPAVPLSPNICLSPPSNMSKASEVKK